jgi:hypothetical protein
MKEKLTGDETDGAENGVMFKLFKVQSSMFRAQTPAEADALRPDYVYSIQRGPFHDTMLTCCVWLGRSRGLRIRLGLREACSRRTVYVFLPTQYAMRNSLSTAGDSCP